MSRRAPSRSPRRSASRAADSVEHRLVSFHGQTLGQRFESAGLVVVAELGGGQRAGQQRALVPHARGRQVVGDPPVRSARRATGGPPTRRTARPARRASPRRGAGGAAKADARPRRGAGRTASASGSIPSATLPVDRPRRTGPRDRSRSWRLGWRGSSAAPTVRAQATSSPEAKALRAQASNEYDSRAGSSSRSAMAIASSGASPASRGCQSAEAISATARAREPDSARASACSIQLVDELAAAASASQYSAERNAVSKASSASRRPARRIRRRGRDGLLHRRPEADPVVAPGAFCPFRSPARYRRPFLDRSARGSAPARGASQPRRWRIARRSGELGGPEPTSPWPFGGGRRGAAAGSPRRSNRRPPVGPPRRSDGRAWPRARRARRPSTLDALRIGGVEPGPPRRRQAVIGHIPGEGVLEGVPPGRPVGRADARRMKSRLRNVTKSGSASPSSSTIASGSNRRPIDGRRPGAPSCRAGRAEVERLRRGAP